MSIHHELVIPDQQMPPLPQALCRTRPDLPWLGGGTDKQVTAARALCCQCPELNPCTRWAVANNEPAGIWGGLSQHQREALYNFFPLSNSKLVARSSQLTVTHLDHPCSHFI